MGDWSRRCYKLAFVAATTIGPDSYYFLKATAISLRNSFVEEHKPLWPPKATFDYPSTSAPLIHYLTKSAFSKMFGKGDLDRIKLTNMARLAQRRQDAELRAGDPQANQDEGAQTLATFPKWH